MIRLITEEFDRTINRLIDNLIDLNLPFERVNTNQFSLITISDFNINYKVKIIYSRRGSYNFLPSSNYEKELYRYLKKEVNDVVYLVESLEHENVTRIGSLHAELTNNKMVNLQIAKNVGFKVPHTIITNCKADLVRFHEQFKNVITKDLKHPPSWIDSTNRFIYNGTFKISKKHLHKLDEFFVPMIFQELIDRKFEIRTFFFVDMFFSVAIIPSDNSIVDIRNTYSQNRIVPFKLPQKVEDKLFELSKKLRMNTFSSDIVVDRNGDFVFLELNPMGQYDFVDQFGNHNIPREIALKFQQIIINSE